MVFLDEQIVHWLRSLGYPVSEKPREHVAAMFLEEARQWGLTPGELAGLIRGDIRRPGESTPAAMAA